MASNPINQDQALEIRLSGDPDRAPQVSIRSAYRDISCSGSGPECYRQFLYAGIDVPQWGDERLGALGFRAASRRASVSQMVPVGTIVLDYKRDRYKGRGGKCAFRAGIVGTKGDGTVAIHWLEHRTLRVRKVYEIALPNKAKIEVERR